MTTAQFLGLGADKKIDIQNLIPQGEGVSDCLAISTLGAYGTTEITYYWIDYGSVGSGCYWSEDMDTPVTGVSFQPGEALWVEAGNEDQSLQSSGQVAIDDVMVQLREGATMAGNPSPLTLDLQDIVPSGEGISDCLAISTLGAYGTTEITYYWIDYGSVGKGSYWSEDMDTPAAGVEVAPGQGLWIEAGNTEQYVYFPGVELK